MTSKLVLTLFVCSFSLMAQPTPPSPEALKTAIGITDAQVQQLITNRKSEHEAVQPIQVQIRDKQDALKTLLEASTTDAAAVGKLVLEIQALRKQIGDTHTRFQAQAVQILTAEQKTKLKTLEEALKLQPAVQQAIGLGLLTPPNPPAGGPGFGGPGPGGPAGGPGPMFGRGMGPAFSRRNQ